MANCPSNKIQSELSKCFAAFWFIFIATVWSYKAVDWINISRHVTEILKTRECKARPRNLVPHISESQFLQNVLWNCLYFRFREQNIIKMFRLRIIFVSSSFMLRDVYEEDIWFAKRKVIFDVKNSFYTRTSFFKLGNFMFLTAIQLIDNKFLYFNILLLQTIFERRVFVSHQFFIIISFAFLLMRWKAHVWLSNWLENCRRKLYYLL